MANTLMIAAGTALALSGAAYGQVSGSGTMNPGTAAVPGIANPSGVMTDSAGNVISEPGAHRDGRRGSTTIDPRRRPSGSTAPLGTTGGVDAGTLGGNAIGGTGTPTPGTIAAPGGVGSSPGITGGASVGGAAGAGGVGVGAGASGAGAGAGASGVGVGAGASGGVGGAAGGAGGAGGAR